jgi:hypothetical protein
MVKLNRTFSPRANSTNEEMLLGPESGDATILISKTGRNEVRELRP